MAKMTKAQAQYLGGKSAGKKLREKALKQYYENPAVCEYCGKVIEVKEGQKPCEVKIKKFCDRSCRTSSINRGQDRHKRSRKRKPYDGSKITKNSIEMCERCGVPVQQTPYPEKRGKLFWRKRFCGRCRKQVRTEIGYRYNGDHLLDLENMTKKQVREATSTYQAYRTAVQKHAKRVYEQSGRSLECSICKFLDGIQVCHRRSVADFPDYALIKEINAIENLVALCPNHHWLLDHNKLSLIDPSPGSSIGGASDR
jgi:hypothetical protein